MFHNRRIRIDRQSDSIVKIDPVAVEDTCTLQPSKMKMSKPPPPLPLPLIALPPSPFLLPRGKIISMELEEEEEEGVK